MDERNFKINININVTISVFLVICIYISNIFSYVSSFDQYKVYFLSIRYVAAFIIIFLVFSNINKIYQHRFYFAVCILLLPSFLFTENTLYLDISMLILFSLSLYIFSKGCFHSYLSIVAIFLMLFFGCFIYFTLVGDIDNQVFKQPSTHYFEFKYSLGFVNPNVISMLLCTFTIVLLVYKRYFSFLLFFFVFSISSIWLGSRTYILVLLFSLFTVFFKKQMMKLNFIVILALMLPALISIFLFLNFQKDVILVLDSFLNGRIYSFYEQIEALSISNFILGFGHVGKIDGAYFNLILSFGLIGYFIFVGIIIYLLKMAKYDVKLYCLLLNFLFICFFENILTVNSILTVLLIYQFLIAKEERYILKCQG